MRKFLTSAVILSILWVAQPAEAATIEVSRAYLTTAGGAVVSCVLPQQEVTYKVDYRNTNSGAENVTIYWNVSDSMGYVIERNQNTFLAPGSSTNTAFSGPVQLPRLNGTYRYKATVNWGLAGSGNQQNVETTFDIQDTCIQPTAVSGSVPLIENYPIPGLPVILAPKNNERVTLPTTFFWTDTGNPLWYQVYIEEAPLGQFPGAEGTRQIPEFTKQPYTGTSLAIPSGTLSAGRNYRLNVWSYKTGGFSQRAATVDFTVLPTAAVLPTLPVLASPVKLGALLTPQLTIPTDHAELITGDAVLRWHLIFSNDGSALDNTVATPQVENRVYIDTNEQAVRTLSTKEYRVVPSAFRDASFPLSQLAVFNENTATYYWRVVSLDPTTGIQMASDVRSFTTAPRTAFIDHLFDTSDGHSAELTHPLDDDLGLLVPFASLDAVQSDMRDSVGRLEIQLVNPTPQTCSVRIATTTDRRVLLSETRNAADPSNTVGWSETLTTTVPAASTDNPGERRIYAHISAAVADRAGTFVPVQFQTSAACNGTAETTLKRTLYYAVMDPGQYHDAILDRRRISLAYTATTVLIPIEEIEEVAARPTLDLRNAFNLGIITIRFLPTKVALRFLGGITKDLDLDLNKLWSFIGADDLTRTFYDEQIVNGKLPILNQLKNVDQVAFKKAAEEVIATLETINDGLQLTKLAETNGVAKVLIERLPESWQKDIEKKTHTSIVTTLTRLIRDIVAPTPHINATTNEIDLLKEKPVEIDDAGPMAFTQGADNGIEVAESPSAPNGTYHEWLYDLDRSRINQLQWLRSIPDQATIEAHISWDTPDANYGGVLLAGIGLIDRDGYLHELVGINDGDGGRGGFGQLGATTRDYRNNGGFNGDGWSFGAQQKTSAGSADLTLVRSGSHVQLFVNGALLKEHDIQGDIAGIAFATTGHLHFPFGNARLEKLNIK